MSCNYAKRALSRAALGARLLTPLKDNQQPNSPESWRAGWNLDHLPAVREDKLPEINSRILENRGKTDGLRCLRSASRLDSPFRSLPIPPSLGWLLATAALYCVFSSRDRHRCLFKMHPLVVYSFCISFAHPWKLSRINPLDYFIYCRYVPCQTVISQFPHHRGEKIYFFVFSSIDFDKWKCLLVSVVE